MSKPAMKSYPAAFKERAVKLAVESEQPIAQTARDLVVYTTAADNSLHPQTRYNVPLTPSSAGALPCYQPSFSTNSVSWRWGASSCCSADYGPTPPLPL